MSADCASINIERTAGDVFDFMAAANKLDLWSFGTWKTSVSESGVVEGRSLFNGATIYLRIQAYPDSGLIDYALGSDPESLQPRIYARVIPADAIDAPATSCLLTLTALRTNDMDDNRWQGLIESHAVEVRLIKSLLESGYDHRG